MNTYIHQLSYNAVSIKIRTKITCSISCSLGVFHDSQWYLIFNISQVFLRPAHNTTHSIGYTDARTIISEAGVSQLTLVWTVKGSTIQARTGLKILPTFRPESSDLLQGKDLHRNVGKIFIPFQAGTGEPPLSCTDSSLACQPLPSHCFYCALCNDSNAKVGVSTRDHTHTHNVYTHTDHLCTGTWLSLAHLHVYVCTASSRRMQAHKQETYTLNEKLIPTNRKRHRKPDVGIPTHTTTRKHKIWSINSETALESEYSVSELLFKLPH